MLFTPLSSCLLRCILFFFAFPFLVISLEAKDNPDIVSGWKRVYLATYPRSGNHWLRYLIEEVTGIATGSIYCDTDPQHLIEPFPWGGFSPRHGYEHNRKYPSLEDIVVIKTHHPLYRSDYCCLPYLKTVRIIRNPVDSIYSNYVYHFGKPKDGIIPSSQVEPYVKEWIKFQRHWDLQHDVVTFRYEDLLLDTENVLTQIINAIGYFYSDEDITRAVNKYPPSGYELKHLDKFKESDLKYIKETLQYYLKKYEYEIPVN